jgi:hypothetical protein
MVTVDKSFFCRPRFASAVLALSVVVLKGAVSAVHMSKRETVPTRFRRHWSSTDRTNVAHIAEPDDLKAVNEADAKAFADENLPAGMLALFDVRMVFFQGDPPSFYFFN